MITITEEEYEYLVDRDKRLTALENSGVDNWEWYDEAMKEFYNKG